MVVPGRYHGQYYNADGNGTSQDDWENRRFRIGSQARFFEKLTLHAQMVSGFDMDPSITDLRNCGRNGSLTICLQLRWDSKNIASLMTETYRVGTSIRWSEACL